MPTADRTAFVPRAIAAFLRQDHPARELVIVDDGVQPAALLIPDDDPRIRYHRLPPRQTVGAKRNLACADARGAFIAHWDDDDWHAPDRLSRQLAAIGDAECCGSTTQLFVDPANGLAWRYDYAALRDRRPWLAGGTLFYAASRWRRLPFAPIDVGEDARFVRADPDARLAVVPGDVVVGVIHAGNVSPKRPRPPLWRPEPLATVATLLGPDWPAFGPGRAIS